MQISKSVEDFTLKHLSVFQIRALEICEKLQKNIYIAQKVE